MERWFNKVSFNDWVSIELTVHSHRDAKYESFRGDWSTVASGPQWFFTSVFKYVQVISVVTSLFIDKHFRPCVVSVFGACLLFIKFLFWLVHLSVTEVGFIKVSMIHFLQ